MKITFEKEKLENAVNNSLCAVSDRNTYPALEGIRFKCEENKKCLITTYDLNKGFLTEIECECEEGGNYIINAQRLCRIIRFLPDTYVTLTIDGKNKATVESGNAKFELPALDGENFPNLPDLTGNEGFEVPSYMLKKMIGEIFFAIAVTDQRPMLCGALMEVTSESLKMVSCDGSRMAIREYRCPIENKSRNGAELNLRFIVPGKTLAQLTRILEDDDSDITVSLGRKHAIFRIGEIIFFSRLLDGEYIDYNRVIPVEPKISTIVNRMAFISSLERASLITEEKTVGQVKGYVKCEFSGDTLKVYSSSVSGSVYDEFPIIKEGEDLLIGFNCKYLLDALKSAEGENVRIRMTSSLLSIVIEPAEGENKPEEEGEKREKSTFLYMISPVRMN